VPTDRAVGVDAAEAERISPFAVKALGSTTHAVSRAIVPEEVIVPPVRPVPATMDVTVPGQLVTVPQQTALEPLLIKT
jgi:hypothetical protein